MGYFMDIFVFIVGACIGSFLGVCISRLPREDSLVSPPSHCPHCDHPVRFYDNIPILSYLLLRGRCRDCRQVISWRYPLVEFLTAVAALGLFQYYGPTWPALVYFVFIACLIVITFIDLDYQIIPDVITLPGIPLFFLAGVFLLNLSFTDALLGLLIGGGSLYALAVGYRAFTGRDGMGGGDIKLLAMMGGLLGWQSLIFIVLVSSFTGAVIGLTVILIKGADMKYAIPFGPFLSLAAVGYIFLGGAFYRWLLILGI